MTVWMMCSSTPLKKEISALHVLIVQVRFEETTARIDTKVFSFSVCNVTGMMVSFLLWNMNSTFLNFDTTIIPGGANLFI